MCCQFLRNNIMENIKKILDSLQTWNSNNKGWKKGKLISFFATDHLICKENNNRTTDIRSAKSEAVQGRGNSSDDEKEEIIYILCMYEYIKYINWNLMKNRFKVFHLKFFFMLFCVYFLLLSFSIEYRVWYIIFVWWNFWRFVFCLRNQS